MKFQQILLHTRKRYHILHFLNFQNLNAILRGSSYQKALSFFRLAIVVSNTVDHIWNFGKTFRTSESFFANKVGTVKASVNYNSSEVIV